MLFRWLALAFTVVSVCVVAGLGVSTSREDPVEAPVASYKYSLLDWELSNFLDKWARKSIGLLPWTTGPDPDSRNALVREYFSLAPGDVGSGRRADLLPVVEEAVEAEISSVLAEEGFASRIGLVFPPVDAVFASSPGVLVLSPRDRIQRLKTVLLEPGMEEKDKEQVEAQFLEDWNLAAIVEPTSGVAVYPSVVSDEAGLRHSVVTASHEWLHHWFFFQPLGQHFWDSPEMTTLNETAATLAGYEIGDRALAAIAGEPVLWGNRREPTPNASGFDFREEMRETRLRTEELLAQGKIDEAESYMEERRLMFVGHGYRIRKINQAYFAFHGSYATSPASVSPILGQLQGLRERSASLGEFLRTVARFGSYEEFQDFVEARAGASGPDTDGCGCDPDE